MSTEDFSVQFEKWYDKNSDKTIHELLHFFDEKSFAVLFLFFMFIPALPVPTGGITNLVLLPSVIIVAFQMMFGRRALWLPKKVTRIPLQTPTLKKAVPFMIRRIRWLENFSNPRMAAVYNQYWFSLMTGFIVFLLAIAAMIAPPFTWLDTLPSLGSVLIALSIILEDIVLYIAGVLIGAAGVVLLIAAADLVINFFQKIL